MIHIHSILSTYNSKTTCLTCHRNMEIVLPGYDPKRHKFTNHWKDNFCRRFHISVQQKTNNKAKSVYERIHKIKNYHYYVIYLLGKEKHTAVVNHFSET